MTATGGDAEALGHEREDYPDPEDYPLPDPDPMPVPGGQGEDILDGSTPDADLQVEKADDGTD